MAKWNMWRRSVGLLVCFSPVLLLVTSLASVPSRQAVSTGGLGFMAAALVVACLNFWLSYIRPAHFRMRHGSMEGYRFVSGIPAVGTLCVLLGGLVSFGEVVPALLGLIATALDTGGLPWFLMITWHDSSFWDE